MSGSGAICQRIRPIPPMFLRSLFRIVVHHKCGKRAFNKENCDELSELDFEKRRKPSDRLVLFTSRAVCGSGTTAPASERPDGPCDTLAGEFASDISQFRCVKPHSDLVTHGCFLGANAWVGTA